MNVQFYTPVLAGWIQGNSRAWKIWKAPRKCKDKPGRDVVLLEHYQQASGFNCTSMTYKKDCYSKPVAYNYALHRNGNFYWRCSKTAERRWIQSFSVFPGLESWLWWGNTWNWWVKKGSMGLRRKGGNVLVSGLFTFIRLNIMRSDYCLFIVRVLKMICLPWKRQCSGC